MVFTLFVFLLLFMWQKMQGRLAIAFKMALSVFAYALPVVAILFLVFPRINFEKAEYGFSDILTKRSGHNGRMSLGSDALLVPSSQVIMELYFTKPLLKSEDLYFRGTVLYVDNNQEFLPLPPYLQHRLASKERASALGRPIAYDVTLYPHDEKWLYALDIPLSTPKKSQLLDDYTLVHDTKIKKSFRYNMRSFMEYRLDAPLSVEVKNAALQVDESRDPQSAAVAKKLRVGNDEETLTNVANYFLSLGLTYTLKPDPFDKKRPIDSFLQENKKGYCVHFAAAFTYMARIAGLPTRVVTGFRTNSDKALGNYLVVREYDSHAWVEVYLKKSGWRRVETTALAKYVERDAFEQLGEPTTALGRFLQESNLRFMYVKYLIETWILEYSRIKQMDILEKLLNSKVYLLKALFSFLVLVLLSVTLALFMGQRKAINSTRRLMTPLLNRLEKEGYVKKSSESMHHFLKRLPEQYDLEIIREIDLLYHQLRYAKEVDEEGRRRLKACIKKLH